MKHCKKETENGECQLATFAMLFDIEYEEIRRIVREELGIKNWINLTFFPDRFFETIERLLTLIAPPEIRDWYKDIREAANFETVFSSSFKETKPPDLSGKGQLSIIWLPGFQGHAAAYEDGWIYDPDMPEPLTWQDWYKAVSHKGARIQFLTTHPLPEVT